MKSEQNNQGEDVAIIGTRLYSAFPGRPLKHVSYIPFYHKNQTKPSYSKDNTRISLGYHRYHGKLRDKKWTHFVRPWTFIIPIFKKNNIFWHIFNVHLSIYGIFQSFMFILMVYSTYLLYRSIIPCRATLDNSLYGLP